MTYPHVVLAAANDFDRFGLDQITGAGFPKKPAMVG
jgi:hypothetical protein